MVKKIFSFILMILMCAGFLTEVRAEEGLATTMNLRGTKSYVSMMKKEMKTPHQVNGTVYYVANTGSDTNSGKIKSPFKTIKHALKILQPGDTILVREGVYKEELVIGKAKSGTENKYTTLAAYPGEKVVISGKNRKSPTLLTIAGAHHIRIEGLRFTRAYGLDACGIKVNAGSHHLMISNNTLYNIKTPNPTVKDHCANAILLFGDSATEKIYDVLLYKNSIHDCVTGWAEALSVTGNCLYINIIKNTIKNTGNIGIDLSGNYGYCSNPVYDFVRKSLVYGNRVSDCVSDNATSYGIYVDGGQDIEITRNTVCRCSGGIEIGAEKVPSRKRYSTRDIYVLNNTITDNVEKAMAIGGYQKNLGWVLQVTVRGNVCKNNGINENILTLAKCDGVTIENNTFYNSSGNAEIIYYEFKGKYSRNVVIRNNTMIKDCIM